MICVDSPSGWCAGTLHVDCLQSWSGNQHETRYTKFLDEVSKRMCWCWVQPGLPPVSRLDVGADHGRFPLDIPHIIHIHT